MNSRFSQVLLAVFSLFLQQALELNVFSIQQFSTGCLPLPARLPQNPNGPGPNPDPTPIGLGFGSKGPTPCWVGSARSDPNGFWGPKWGYKQDKQTKIFRCITYTFFSCKFRYLIYSHFHKSGNNSAGRDNRSLSSDFIHINTTNDTQTDHLPCFSAFVLTP